LSPVSSQEFVSSAQSLPSPGAIAQDVPETAETTRKVCASVTVLGLALTLGASGSFLTPAEASEAIQLAALPSVSGSVGILPSFGSSRPDGASATYHTVAAGETIWDIAKSHGISVEEIRAANGIAEDQVIQAGQVLKVPTVTELAPPDESAVEAETDISTEVALLDPSIQLEEASVEVEDVQEAVPTQEIPTSKAQAQPADLSEFFVAQPQSTTEVEVDSEAAADLAEVPPTLSALPTDESNQVLTLPPFDLPKSNETKQSQAIASQTSQVEALAAVPEVPVTIPNGSPSLITPAQSGLPTHVVAPGETIWSIARRYDVEPAAITRLNGINNPARIISGDDLIIPVESASRVAEQSSSAEPLAAVPTSTSDGTHSSDAMVSDPFINGLLQEVSEGVRPALDLVQADRAIALSPAPDESTPVVAVRSRAVSRDEEAVNLQFAPDATPAEETSIGGFSPNELLAVAPLGSEIYAPAIRVPEGQLVSPEMPVLPGQDEYLPEAPDQFNGYIWPARGVLTSGYGWRWGRMHQGVDIAGPVGTPIYAAAPGVVVRSGWNSGGYGNMVDIRHPDGSLTRYAHNSRLLVAEGQEVSQGQQIAEMGSTGYSTGSHLHFEIHVPQQGRVNPIALLPGR
jgi:murein DD-endopeptidase MepM/ murein hydrolase activator NlpD